ncbi:MAG: hypothetical protein NVSMB9_22730 [Isosphaeraceae bacterium]
MATSWLGMTVLTIAMSRGAQRLPIALSGILGLSVNLMSLFVVERRWVLPVRALAARIHGLTQDPARTQPFDEFPPLQELGRALNGLADAARRLRELSPTGFTLPGDSGTRGNKTALSRSDFLNVTSDVLGTPPDGKLSVAFSTADMVNRLEPRLLRWLESSPAEQVFLGWKLPELRQKSFLEIVHPDDLDRVRDQLRTAMVKGEAHGLILRVRTAHGKLRAIEMNIGARYGTDSTLSHLRCHITDVTNKVRAERELRLRTRELIQVNDQLRLINRELEELKERYRDLYQNSPAMYFSLDDRGRILECNQTLLETLGYRPEAIVGQSYDQLMPETVRGEFEERFARFMEAGLIEIHSQWIKASGEVIDVWITGTAVRGVDGRVTHSRSVAQDVTARFQLEAQLREKNKRLARTIEELSRRNREMDEFTYVVSHDLQEPLRTLTSFSDFLQRDHGNQLGAEGQEFVLYIVEASRRMRALIHDLLTLSRSGTVTSEFSSVNLESVLGVVSTDLGELIRSKAAKVEVNGPLPEVWGDRTRLGQLFSNLITNGLKYNDKSDPVVKISATPEGPPEEDGAGEAEVFARSASHWATFHVQDNGIGIESRFHEKIFQLFRRLHTREEYEGTGAGLAICSKIVDAHKGKIWVESDLGQGSTFHVCLPLTPVAVTSIVATNEGSHGS